MNSLAAIFSGEQQREQRQRAHLTSNFFFSIIHYYSSPQNNIMHPIHHMIARPDSRTTGRSPVPQSEGPLLVSVEFEVFGETQGTLFLKYARDMCHKLGLNGWIRASPRLLTVIGEIQGPKDRIDEMALWLRLQGSPGSRIDHTDFTNWKIVDRLDYRTFSIRF